MAIYLTNRDGNGKTNEEGHYRLPSKMLVGQTMGADSLKVIETSPLSLNVLVQTGDYRIDTAAGYAYTGWLSADETVSITTPDPANPRITSVVLYVDKTAETTAIPPNNPGITKLIAVNGTATATPSAPSGAVIQSAVGAGNPYIVLADISVGAGATTITNSNITDLRTTITLNPELLKGSDILASVGTLLFPVGSIYTNAAVNTNPATLLGFGTWSEFGTGRVLVGVDSTQTEFNTLGKTGGTKTHILSVAELPSHTHVAYTEWGTSANLNSSAAGGNYQQVAGPSAGTKSTQNAGTSPTGSGTGHNNLQPYVTVYMWRRTA